MADSGLTADMPLGPFDGMLIQVHAGKGKNSRLHASDACSVLRTSDVRHFMIRLDAGAMSRMCRSCTEWGHWGRPGTALSVFLNALSGLSYQLDRYTPDDLAEDLRDRDVMKAAGLLASGDWPGDEDGEEVWRDYKEARFLRDELLLPFWRGAADSLHAALGTVGRYPWLEDWAQSRLALKAAYAEQLQRQLGELIDPQALLDAAAAYFLTNPELPVNRPGFAAFGDAGRIRAVLQQAWRQWQEDTADSWLPLNSHSWRVHAILDSALGKRRKGREEAQQAISDLYQEWAHAARRAVDDAQEPSMLIAVSVPEADRREEVPGREEIGFDRLLTLWQLGVIAVHTVAADWGRRVMLLRVPGLVGRRLLEETSDLQCIEVTDTTGTGAEPAQLLAAWVRENLPSREGALLPGVLDDVPVYERRAVSSDDVEVLCAEQDTASQPYLVFSTSHGIEVLQPSTLATRCQGDWRGIVIAGASDLPPSVIEPWADQIANARDRRLAADVPYAHDSVPESPEDADFGTQLGMPAGEQALADWHTFPRKRARDLDADLRILALARAATDLRPLGNRDTRGRQPVPPGVWYALLAFRQLDLAPFRSGDDDEFARYQGGLGLPLSVLAPAQVYTTNGDPQYGKGHGPHCQHARDGAMALDPGYDLLTIADLIRGDHDWCSKCGGYAIRRLNEVQLRYYRAAHRLHDINKHLRRYTRDPYSPAAEHSYISPLLSELGELVEMNPDPSTGVHDRDYWRWRDAARLVQVEAQRISTTAGNASSGTETIADVLPLSRNHRSGELEH